MPVVGVQFKALEARRYQDPQARQQVRVDHNSNLSQVQKTGDGRLSVEFAFTTSYGAIGMVKIEGVLTYQGDDIDAILEHWGKDRNLPPERAQEVHSAILGACVPEAVVLAKELRLPPPVPIPQVRFQTKTPPAPPHEGPDAA